MQIDPNYMALSDALFGYALARTAEVGSPRKKLAHYTSAENALNILTGKKIWLRSAAVMNDHSEIEHGRAILAACLDTDLGQRFWTVLDQGHAGLAKRVRDRVAASRQRPRDRIFMVSLSEHDETDRLGRLSMWRAYGGPTAGAAIIFNTEIFDDAQINLMSFASPVLYGGAQVFAPQFEAVIAKLEAGPHLLNGVSADVAFNAVASALDFAILSTKHIGFGEEREWRVIHLPFDYASASVTERLVTIRGTPQLIYELPLVNQPGMNMPKLTLDRLIHTIIIGPALHAETCRRALVEALRMNGVQQPENRVVVSDIPLRQWG
jgi:hypothetical protein